MATVINTKNLRYLPIVHRDYEDAVMLPVTGLIDFSQDTAFVLDLSTIPQTQKLINQIQGVYFQAPSPVSDQFAIQVTTGGLSFRLKPPSNGTVPLPMIRNQYVITLINFSGALEPASAPLNVFFVNFPVHAFTQNLDPIQASLSNLNVSVTNTPLGVTVANTPLGVAVSNTPLPVTVQNAPAVNPALYSNSAGNAFLNAPRMVGNQIVYKSLTVATNLALLTAPAGTGFYVTSIWMQPAPTAQIASPGNFEVQIYDSAVAGIYLFHGSWNMTNTSNNTYFTPTFTAPGFFYNSKTAASSLVMNSSAALTLAQFRTVVTFGFSSLLLGY